MGALRTVLATLALAALHGQAHAEQAEYRLGPQDQVEVRVSDLRAGTGEAYQWTTFNGAFTVSASGRVSLPLVGELQAGDRTTGDLAALIATQLQAKVGLAKPPDASVQVVKYRPVYVTGSVEKPGDYEYRPGLTVLQAMSVAGGLARVTSDVLLTYARDAVATRGDLRVLLADRLGLIVRQARLDAEIKDAPTFDPPADVLSHSDDAVVSRLIREERMLFESRRNSLQSQIDALDQAKVSLRKQIDSLTIKEASLAHQVQINQTELDQIAGLVERGIAVVPRRLAIEQIIAQFESDRIDTVTTLLRAQQDLAKAERDGIDLKNTRRNDSLQEATEIRTKLAETAEKIDTDQNLILQAEVRAPLAVAATVGASAAPTYFLTRRVEGKIVTRPAQESDEVLPGDVVRVDTRPGTQNPNTTADSSQD